MKSCIQAKGKEMSSKVLSHFSINQMQRGSDMKKIFLIFLLLFGNSEIRPQAQQTWVNRYNNNLTNYLDFGKDITVDRNGNAIVTGMSWWGGTSGDYYTIKYSMNGSLLWQYRLALSGDDVAYSVATDDSSNIYVTGASEGESSQFDFVTIKFTPGGFLSLTQRYNGTGNDIDVAEKVVVSGNGYEYVAGSSIGANGDHDFAVVKYSSGLVQQWVQRIDAGNEEHFSDMVVDASGNVFLTGYTDAFDSYDLMTIKYDPAGNLQWVRYHDGKFNGTDSATSIAVDSLGNVYVAGYEWAGISEAGNIIVIMYDTFGNGQWIRYYNGPNNSTDVATDIGVDRNGAICVGGSTDNGVSKGYDYILLKYDISGVPIWTAEYDGVASGDDKSTALAIDDSSNISLTGISDGLLSGTDYTTVKFDLNGDQLWAMRYNGTANGQDQALAVDTYGSTETFVTGLSTGTNFSDFATLRYSPFAPSILQLTALIEGFYNPSTNQMVSDTVTAYLRDFNAPYALVDSAKSVLNSSGTGTYSFYNSVNGNSYYLVVKHRNSIETWSRLSVSFVLNQLTYNFTTAATKAYGNNLKLKGTKYCIYSGDVNRDGSVDASDMALVDNDLFNFVTGYTFTDVDGDNNVDASDLSITDNNSYNFVSLIRP